MNRDRGAARAPHEKRSASHGGDAGPGRDKPRYGGGAPGRRALDVRHDWGGGAGRGSTRDDRASSGDDAFTGRGGASRTTGSGGGIGAGPGDYRMSRGRRGRR